MQPFEIQGRRLTEDDLGSYLHFRQAVPKPAGEERHARHIQRFYASRGLRKVGYPDIYVLPELTAGGEGLHPDVVGQRGEGSTFVYCAAISLDEIPRSEIARLMEEAGPMVMLVVANVLDVDAINAELATYVSSGRLSIRTMTLPPFDDVLEYDIWMFELTFQEAAR